MASTVAATASRTSFLKPMTLFLGQGCSNVNPLRDAVSEGSGRHTMEFSGATAGTDHRRHVKPFDVDVRIDPAR